MKDEWLERGRALVARGEGVTPEDQGSFREDFLDWRRTVEQAVDAESAREVRRLVGPTGLLGGGGPEAYAQSGGVGRLWGRLDVHRDWVGPMQELLALLEVELPAPTASWPLVDVQRALEAVDGVDSASLAAALGLVFPVGRVEEVRPGRRAFLAGRLAVVSEHVLEGVDAEPALQAFLEDLTAIVVDASEVTEVVFALWCADDGVAPRLASLQTELSHEGRRVRTHPLQLTPPSRQPSA